MDLTPAVDKAIQDMPANYEIKGFLTEHQSEVKNMCITEYNEAEAMELFKKEGHEEGVEEHLSRQIFRKLRKGKDIAQIAEEVEKDADRIKPVCDAIAKLPPEYDEDQVIKALRQV